jgi:hypothetical protein
MDKGAADLKGVSAAPVTIRVSLHKGLGVVEARSSSRTNLMPVVGGEPPEADKKGLNARLALARG